MNTIVNISRRDFIKTSTLAGGGLILGIYLTKASDSAFSSSDKQFVPNAFIRISPDDIVTIIVNKSEMGQGVYTSLPMLVAEELEAEWSTIRVEPAPVDPVYNHTYWGTMQGTGGSTSVRSSWEQLTKAGAAARMMLIEAAAQTWKVTSDTCYAEHGSVIHEKSKKRLFYGQLVEKAAQLKVPDTIPLKEPENYKIIGQPRKRLDTQDKVHGTAIFGIDVNLPGMLTAVVARSPVFGGKVKSYDDTKAKKISGVKAVVPISSGIAVVADSFWSASEGRNVLEVVWDKGELADLDSTTQKKQYAEMANKEGIVAAQKGNFSTIFLNALKKVEAVYEVPYLAHAPMEPLNCVAHVRTDGCEIWTGTQLQTGDRNAAAHIAQLPPEKVKLHTTFLGGGFGRRGVPDAHFVAEAVQISKAMKKPIKVLWTREDDIQGGYYRPRAYHVIKGGLDKEGMPIAWHHRIVGQSIMKGTPFEAMMKDNLDPSLVEGASDLAYDIPNLLVDCHVAPPGVPVLWWRSVGHSFTAFVKECFIDELAHASGKDPYEYRRTLLKNHPRERGVLEYAADKAGWSKPLPKGRTQGIAVHKSFGSYVAQVAEVSVSPEGKVRVHKVVCAIDCGRFVNPDTIKAQMESGIVFGLTAALYGIITFKNGRVEQSNFHNYQMLRMKERPEVEVFIVDSSEAPGGIGEPGVPPIAPAVVNALFAATGKRIRRLPITPETLKKKA
jgi:isoquinoline 1-oxidoreductase beta subunit